MMTENITNPKLKEAMGEIEEILKKHDIAAVIALHTPGHGEIKLHIAPTYSVARMVREPDEHGAMRDDLEMIRVVPGILRLHSRISSS